MRIPIAFVLFVLVASVTTADDDKSKKSLALAEKGLKKELKALVDAVDQEKSAIKKTMIADDAMGVARHKKELANAQSALTDLLKLKFKPLSATEMKIGQVGLLPRASGRLVRKPPTTPGQDIFYHYDEEGVVINVVGMIGTSRTLVGGTVVWQEDKNRVFVVVGEVDAPGKRKAMEIVSVDIQSPFSEVEVKEAELACDSSYSVSLSEQEKKQQKESEARHKAEKDMEIQKKEKLASDASARRAQSLVDLGKSLLKSNNKAGAKKQFEKAISEAAESEAGKEAKKLIEDNP